MAILFLVATADERVVGSLIGGWYGWRGGLYRLAVDPEFRRMGIATRLVSEVETRLRLAGAERVPIRVLHGEPGAVEFWRSVGYEPEPDETIFVKNLYVNLTHYGARPSIDIPALTRR